MFLHCSVLTSGHIAIWWHYFLTAVCCGTPILNEAPTSKRRFYWIRSICLLHPPSKHPWSAHGFSLLVHSTPLSRNYSPSHTPVRLLMSQITFSHHCRLLLFANHLYTPLFDFSPPKSPSALSNFFSPPNHDQLLLFRLPHLSIFGLAHSGILTFTKEFQPHP